MVAVRAGLCKGRHEIEDKGEKIELFVFEEPIENPNDYGIDIMAPVYEVERRTIKSEKWPYQTVHVPKRKTKFLKPNTWYVVNIHHDLGDLSADTLLFCSKKKIAKCPVFEFPNRSIPKW